MKRNTLLISGATINLASVTWLLAWLLMVFTLCIPLATKADERQRLMVMGDSLSAAYNMTQEQGWVALLAERLGDDIQVINTSVSGETSGGGAQRLPDLLGHYEPDMVLLALGGNDGLRGLSPQQMHDNLAQMIEHSQAIDADVILLGIDIPPNYGSAYREAFTGVFQQLAKHYDLELLPFLLEGVALNDDLMQKDGIHPTAEAQPLILENVWPLLAPRLERPLAPQAGD